jgi:hypothetical protein
MTVLAGQGGTLPMRHQTTGPTGSTTVPTRTGSCGLNP